MLFEVLIKAKRKSKNVLSGRFLRWNRFSIKQWLFISFVFTISSFFILSHFMPNSLPFHGLIRIPPKSQYKCHSHDDSIRPLIRWPVPNIHSSNLQLRLDSKVLVLLETQYSKMGKQLIEMLESSRIKYVFLLSNILPLSSNLLIHLEQI